MSAHVSQRKLQLLVLSADDKTRWFVLVLCVHFYNYEIQIEQCVNLRIGDFYCIGIASMYVHYFFINAKVFLFINLFIYPIVYSSIMFL